MTIWEDIHAFAKELTGLTEADVEVWVRHTLQRCYSRACSCPACAKHALYTNIAEALVMWENRQKSAPNEAARKVNSPDNRPAPARGENISLSDCRLDAEGFVVEPDGRRLTLCGLPIGLPIRAAATNGATPSAKE